MNLMDCDEVRKLITTRTAHQALPNAIVTVHDAVAMTFTRTAASIGLTPPGDFAVVGFDDLPASSHLNVPLTTVAQPRYDMGFHSGHMLIDHIEGRMTESEKLVLPVSLVVRESCGVRRILAGRQKALSRRVLSQVSA
jgi:DNA-binding LacI/PurR family transcriptional regulator